MIVLLTFAFFVLQFIGFLVVSFFFITVFYILGMTALGFACFVSLDLFPEIIMGIKSTISEDLS